MEQEPRQRPRGYADPLGRKLAVLDPVRAVGLGAEALVAVGLVVLVVALVPDDLAVALEREHVRRDAVEEPAVVADDDGAAAEREERLFERAKRVDVEVVRGLVEEQQVAAPLERPREMEAVHLAAREVRDELLLVGALEVVHRAEGAARHLTLAEHHEVLAARELVVHRLFHVGLLAVLVHVAGDDVSADLQLATVGFLEPHDHLEERRLPRAVRADDPDDAALRQVEGEVFEEQLVAEGLPHSLGPDDDVSEARPRRNIDFVRLAAGFDAALADELLVGLQARLALRLPGAGGQAHPLQLALERPLARAFGLLLDLEAGFLLLEARGIVALPGYGRSAVALADPARAL